MIEEQAFLPLKYIFAPTYLNNNENLHYIIPFISARFYSYA